MQVVEDHLLWDSLHLQGGAQGPAGQLRGSQGHRQPGGQEERESGRAQSCRQEVGGREAGQALGRPWQGPPRVHVGAGIAAWLLQRDAGRRPAGGSHAGEPRPGAAQPHLLHFAQDDVPLPLDRALLQVGVLPGQGRQRAGRGAGRSEQSCFQVSSPGGSGVAARADGQLCSAPASSGYTPCSCRRLRAVGTLCSAGACVRAAPPAGCRPGSPAPWARPSQTPWRSSTSAGRARKVRACVCVCVFGGSVGRKMEREGSL